MSTYIPKYSPLQPIPIQNRTWPDRNITKNPIWCSVDLRDGNQALPNPLSPEKKLEYFQLLCDIGFKNIEVAFPSASQDDFDFTRKLITENIIPDDVFIMVLTQCREHLISRSFEAFKGVKQGIMHIYLALSDLHIEQVFGLSREETLKIAVNSAKQCREISDSMPESDIRLEFSPEEFTDSDLTFVKDVCIAVVEAWGKATPAKPIIINLPATVERRPPNHYADMIEWFDREFPYRDKVLISLHAHNDQGMAVAATELGLLAGADRVEGALFGHGERTGNVDLITIASNLSSRGIDTGLDFSQLPQIASTIERLTGMGVYYRQPYAGELVFTAFSGSHQDAIRKGLQRRKNISDHSLTQWKVPYLHVDPADFGRAYEKIIRVNSQSGKGGFAWILENDYGLKLPKSMHPELGKKVQVFLDHIGREISSKEIYKIFLEEFIREEGYYRLIGFWPTPDPIDPTFVSGNLKIMINNEEKSLGSVGNGPLSAFTKALQQLTGLRFKISEYHEQSLGTDEDATAYAYVQLNFTEDNVKFYGVGSSTNIGQAGIKAIISALNRYSIYKKF